MEKNLVIPTDRGDFVIRPIESGDNVAIRDIIVETLLEFGASGDGFACNDPETSQMYEAAQENGRVYYVIEDDHGLVLGGGGVAPLKGSREVCEFVKMYYRKDIRGLGLGKKLLHICIEDARQMGYTKMYLETLERMDAARGLYEKFGFKQIDKPIGATGHYSCDAFYVRGLGD